eukprot:scaffold22759_cov98-Cylindrotheca_fusiformis.AAC.1
MQSIDNAMQEQEREMSETPQYSSKRNATPAASVNKMLASELEKLSLEERERVYEDVHGVSDVIQETPELIANCLEQMDREIDLIKNKDTYEQARLQSSNFKINRKYRLAFLRSTLFNPKMAALHLVEYFRYKLELLGTEQPAIYQIALEDLGAAATRVLELGSTQVLPNRDSKGRAIAVFSPSVLEPVMGAYDTPTMVKAIWYSLSTLSEDEETQKKGVVGVLNMSGLSEFHEEHHRELLSRLTVIGQVLPLRVACLHCCDTSSSSLTSTLLSIVASAANPILRVRMRTHYGSHPECLYKLVSFGIPVEEFPFTADGGVRLTNHVKWIGKRRKKEAYLHKYPPIEGAVDIPSNSDVLWGRGNQIYQHPGNCILRELVETYHDEYNALWKHGKTDLAHRIVSVVHGFSGRFLKLDKESGMWVEVSDSDAREKVAHRFRRNRELALKKGCNNSIKPPVASSSKETDRDRKRPRKMFNGS